MQINPLLNTEPYQVYNKYPLPYKGKFKLYKKIILDFFNPEELNKRLVLDAGCGAGTVTLVLGKLRCIVTAVDKSTVSLEICKRRTKANCFLADVLDLSQFADHSFDHCVSLGVLHHTLNPQKGLENLIRKTKPGGKILISLYNKHSLYYLIHNSRFLRNHPALTKSMIRLIISIYLKRIITSPETTSWYYDLFIVHKSFHTAKEIKTWAKNLKVSCLKRTGYGLGMINNYLFRKQF